MYDFHDWPSSSSTRCSSLLVPSVATASAWVSPRVNRQEPCVRGSTPTSTVGAHPFAEHHAAQLVALDVVQDLADVGLVLREALLERGHRLQGDAVNLLLARLLAGNADRLAQALAVALVERG